MSCSTVLPPGCLQPVVLDLGKRTPVVVPDCGGPAVLPDDTDIVVVTQALQGVPGPPGIPGPAGGAAVQRQAGETLSALVAVWEDEQGRVFALDQSDEDHVFCLLGLTLTAADAGQAINVQRSGVIDDDSWSWTPGQRIYLGAAGALTASPATTGFDVLIGTALSTRRIALNVQDPIEME